MTEVRLTVITPVFNGARYIEACLQNVVSQNCPFVEHLVMDGASTDGTAQMVSEWAQKYPHISLISEKDNGQSDAMNKGISLAKGKIISFLNVDDFYEPNVLNRALDVFSDLPEPSFVCGNLNIWNSDGSLKHFHRPTNVTLVELVTHLYEWPYNPSAYFYHKSLHDKIGMYNLDNHLCMDYEFVLKAAGITQFIHIDETWGNFVMVEGSKTQVSHAVDPDQARLKGISLRKIAYKSLSPENQKLADELIKTGKKNKVGNTNLLGKLSRTLKSILRF